MSLGANDKVWKSLAAELKSHRGLQTRDMTHAEHQWLADTLQGIADAYEKNDTNYARTLSHLVVSEGYRKQEQPQNVWVRMLSPGLQTVQQVVNQQNQMLAQMQYQNQMALQQAMLTPYWQSPVVMGGTYPVAPTYQPQSAFGAAQSAFGASQPVYGAQPVRTPVVSFQDAVPKPELSRHNAMSGSVSSQPEGSAQPESQSDYESEEQEDKVSPTPEGQPDSYSGFKIGDSVVRKNQPCTLVDIDFSTIPPDAIIKMKNGRQITTEFEQLRIPKKKSHSGFSEGDKVIRKGRVCTLIDIDFAMDPPGAIVLTEAGNEVSTEFRLLSKPENKED